MSRLSIILFEPEIPPNTGNIIRLCANTGAKLHLIKPLGFELEDKALRRAGLDYHEWADLKTWDSLDECLAFIQPNNAYAMTTKGTRSFFDVKFSDNDALIFGPETRGLPMSFLESRPHETLCRLPMSGNGRSLNLSNSVAISIYEAWRQLDFTSLS
ncbi:tRNA (uridine(34)/cytosine(34)/5-carboxymethylaminomethyluridine(34)-2'-O)-methyltransferase TrmL [Wohlfahrtiimonas chitiniclastica]|uniref:tRNA (cytidine(34)-2'-O)-methyltransferase n=1 Tax=Wohlfahrtiimonas chitiniclastica SH04 TaxID=1261130 RepID=L8Y072_9GAMM|nr:tRNA (uridine(34)/cytosine(34)/5-carboxymethylaminomethyluridine(34)-2'-O)-methyltransferase TrmL [Wohlfahrtiimonas chitiniclastica]ELV08464.1 tRNA (cytidine(34)-2'-O)-methyltransferase [Wohlfahrtiimonas chitiniclastica SH04]KZS22643.1 tRNA (cytidine(34)-2'-O)-methyltransferase [Wohlfahrtiimonas chitiniclastica]KZX38128.1 tRNA (cytosine(34)-2'-O)-methyltransferase TrmL [Wohlfahrtiimonas chitiniclastica]MBS7815073.1 tRNA (uridine(34)/cytosine(34)/5-carboxymethylaminomethyluridine(34)-2'-O)-me